MARPERHDADYFPFYAKDGRTLYLLQTHFGLEGIGFFTNLFRLLCLTPDHHVCIEEEAERLYVLAKIGVIDERKAFGMFDLMAKTGKIDADLWHRRRVIVSEAFLNSLVDAYDKRKNDCITIEQIRSKYPGNSKKDTVSGVSGPETPGPSETPRKTGNNLGKPCEKLVDNSNINKQDGAFKKETEKVSSPGNPVSTPGNPKKDTVSGSSGPETPEASRKTGNTGSITHKGKERKGKETNIGADGAIDENDLFHSVKETFESKYGRFENYGKEGKAIKGLIKKATDLGLEPDIVLPQMIEKFYKLTQSGDKFWRSQPFLPSALNASGIWARVKVQAEGKSRESPATDKYLKKRYGIDT